ncbi:hypothetical protein [Peribacillus glennii]|uniref:Uncharacterized protein n=1 Tax=Peribacillus glennii TaxID=2303991 RepID=A0A372L793_9BACI|nr:hypothetical protein [Peribacillus glennii]RFU61103.1 hypothetical protein D0466_19150 [Peribacillus glennii]
MAKNPNKVITLELTSQAYIDAVLRAKKVLSGTTSDSSRPPRVRKRAVRIRANDPLVTNLIERH